MVDANVLPEEQALIADALRGDEAALGRLLRQHQEWAYNVAYRILGQEADARDAVQDAFLLTVRAVRGDGSPPHSPETFKPWLRRVVTTSALAQVRRRPATRPIPVDDVAESLPGPAHAEPATSAEQGETREQILQVLLSLPQTQRVALAQKEYLDATYDEIAETLGVPRTAIGTLLFRARASFRSAYDRAGQAVASVECPDLVPLFSTIVDNEPPPPAWNDLEEHLRDCDRCQHDLEGQRRARRLYALIPLALLPAQWDPISQALGGAAASTGVAPAVPAGLEHGGAAASGASTASAVGPAAPVAPAAAAGISVSTIGSGVLAGLSGVKVALVGVAAAGMVGAAIVAAPFVEQAPAAGASPSPSPVLVASPPALAASPSASPGIVASPPASPQAGSSPAVGSIVFPTASPSAAPTPGAVTAPIAPAPVQPAAPPPSPSPIARDAGVRQP